MFFSKTEIRQSRPSHIVEQLQCFCSGRDPQINSCPGHEYCTGQSIEPKNRKKGLIYFYCGFPRNDIAGKIGKKCIWRENTPFLRSLFERFVSFKCGLNIIHNKEEKDCTKKSIGGKEPLCVTREAFSNPIITSSNGPTRVTITNKTISKLKRYKTAKNSIHAAVCSQKIIHFVQMNNETESGGYYFAQNIASYLCTICKNKKTLNKMSKIRVRWRLR